MSSSVIDSSALLALLFKEPGGFAVIEHLSDALLSAVNLSEVVAKCLDAGMMLEDARRVVADLPCRIVPFDPEQALLSASLRAATRPYGLSFGGLACLSLGLKTGYPVVTAERAWAECGVGVDVICIR